MRFQFPSRANQLRYASNDAERDALLEQRDVELEDHLVFLARHRLAVRHLTAGSTAILASATTAIPFADNVGANQASVEEPGFGNPTNGRVTFAAAGLYLFHVDIQWSTSFTPLESGIAMTDGGASIGSQRIHGAFARSRHTFSFALLPGNPTPSIGFSVFNGTAGTITASSSAVTVTRVTQFDW